MEHEGAVVITTIDKYATVRLVPREGRDVAVVGEGGQVARFTLGGELPYDGKLDLVKAVLNYFKPERGFELHMRSEMPTGSGMGTSSSQLVALIGCVSRFVGREMSKGEVAELAYRLEREELGQKGGYQDQYAAAFGGFNYMTFFRGKVEVQPLALPQELLSALRERLLLFFLGRTRLSGAIHEDIAKRLSSKQAPQLGALHELKRLALEAKEALLRRDLERFGELLHLGWLNKKMLSPLITNPELDKIYEEARRMGALGGKILGAGGGGHFLVFSKAGAQPELIALFGSIGASLVPFDFERGGLEVREL
jgi:D-glycero-alpha-D-manno-heptose-7-phosphate kinase